MKGKIILAAVAMSIGVSAPAFAVQQTFVQATDTIHGRESKIVSVNCPSGFFASGGGYSIDSAQQKLLYVAGIQSLGNGNITWQNAAENIPNLTISLNQPTTGTGDGWAVGGTAIHDTAVTVYAMCVARG